MPFQHCHYFYPVSLLNLTQIIGTDILLKTIKDHFTFKDSSIINELELKTELQLWKSNWIRKKNEGNKINR